MAIREILMIGNPLLREICEEVYEINDEILDVIKDLRETLLHLQEAKEIGRALAAPQIGYKKRVVFAKLNNRRIIMINPVIIERSIEQIDVWDSCYSFDVSFFVEIKRDRNIKVRYKNELDEIIVEEFKDDLSELFQHEIDHLDGKLATDYLCDNRKIVSRTEWEKRHKKKS